MPEKEPQIFKVEARERPIEILRGFIKDISLELKKDGVPLDTRGRIDTNQFKGVYSERIIKADKKWIEELRGIWQRGAVSDSQWSWILPREQILKQTTVGDVWEMLAMAILHKNFGKDFIVCRTSEYDDARNKVDSIILDKKTGNVVCAFDDVGDTSGRVFQQKKSDVQKRNWERGGADLFYGLSFDERRGRGELKKSQSPHIPLFYFACSEGDVRKALEVFSGGRTSPDEQKIFKKFTESFREQIDELRHGPLHPKLEQRLRSFEVILNGLENMVK